MFSFLFIFRFCFHDSHGCDRLFEFLVPFGAVCTNEGFFEELVGGQLEFGALLAGALADIPVMIVQGRILAQLLDADGIEITGDRFAEGDLTVEVGLFDGTEAHAILVVGERAGLVAGHQRGGELAFAIKNKGVAVIFDNGNTFFGHIFLENRVILIQISYFVGSHRGARVAVNTALSFALIEIAAEALFNEFVRNENIPNYQHNRTY